MDVKARAMAGGLQWSGSGQLALVVIGMALMAGAHASELTVAAAPAVAASSPPSAVTAAGAVQRVDITGTGHKAVPKDSTTATKMDVATRDVPASLQVISPQMIEDMSKGQSINDVLRSVSGVSQSYGTATGNLPAVMLRGFDTGGYVMRDGYGQASGTTYDWSSIERLEVLKGPSSVLYGTQYNIGGQINIISKRPVDRDITELELSAGRWNYGRVALDLNRALDEDHAWLFRLNAAWDDADSFRDAIYERNKYLAPSLKWTASATDSLLLQMEYKDRGYVWDPGLPSWAWDEGTAYPGLSKVRRGFDLPINQYIGLPWWDGQREIKTTFTLEWEHDFSDRWHLKLGVSPTDTDYSGKASWFYWDQSDAGALQNHVMAYTYSQKSLEVPVTLDLTGKFEALGLKHNLLMGVSYTQGRWHDKGPNSQLIYRPAESVGPDDWRHPPRYTLVADTDNVAGPWRYSQTESGAYTQDMLELGVQWKALVGLRFSQTSGSYWGVWNNEEYSGERPAQHGFTPRLGLVYQPSKALSLYTGWSKSFTPNWGRLRNGGTPPPEQGRQWEVGAKWDFADDKANLNASLYQIDKTSVERCAPESADCKLVVTVGGQRSRGLEIDINGEVLPNFRLTNAYTFQQAGVTKDVPVDEGGLPVGDQMNGVPRWILALYGVYSFKAGALDSLELGLGYNAAGPVQANLPNDGFVLPGVRRLDLLAGYQVSRQWHVQANLNNVTNRVNYSSPGWGYMAFAYKPRELVLTATWKP